MVLVQLLAIHLELVIEVLKPFREDPLEVLASVDLVLDGVDVFLVDLAFLNVLAERVDALIEFVGEIVIQFQEIFFLLLVALLPVSLAELLDYGLENAGHHHI